jgi:hypothetical protein
MPPSFLQRFQVGRRVSFAVLLLAIREPRVFQLSTMLQVTSGEGEANHQRFIRACQNTARQRKVIPPSPGGFGGRAEKKRGNSRCPALALDSFLLYWMMITKPEVPPASVAAS